MANSLLDFVMSVVRDPDVAARYAADPAQAIADAHLTDVTSADVNGLIPVVTESISAAPSSALDGFGDGGNVWSSGAATAAFDAFDADLPVQGIDHPLITDGIEQPDDIVSTVVDTGDGALHSLATADDPAWASDAPMIDPAIDQGSIPDALPVDDWSGLADTPQPAYDPHIDTPGFDVFD